MDAIASIVAATDFSADAQFAAHRAAILAAQHQAGLSLLHVVESDAFLAFRDWLDDRDLAALLVAQAEIELDALAGTLVRTRQVQARTMLRTGRVIDQLNAAEGLADLLVLGGRGSHPLRELALGSTADRLLRTATRPLLVVRAMPAAPYQRVLVLVDFSASSAAAVRAAARLAPHASIHLLHTFEVPFEGKLKLAGVSDSRIADYRAEGRARAAPQFQRLLDGFEDQDRTRFTPRVEHGDVLTRFLDTVAQVQPDLVAVGKQGQSLVQDFFLGSVTRAVLAEAQCDVLVVPRGAREPEGDA